MRPARQTCRTIILRPRERPATLGRASRCQHFPDMAGRNALRRHLGGSSTIRGANAPPGVRHSRCYHGRQALARRRRRALPSRCRWRARYASAPSACSTRYGRAAGRWPRSTGRHPTRRSPTVRPFGGRAVRGNALLFRSVCLCCLGAGRVRRSVPGDASVRPRPAGWTEPRPRTAAAPRLTARSRSHAASP